MKEGNQDPGEEKIVSIEYNETYQGCYVCGKDNREGFQLDFHYDEERDEMHTVCIFHTFMQGYERVVHGGFISMLLDEVMAKACLHRDLPAVTVQFEVRFRKPVYVDEEVVFSGKIVEIKGRRVRTEARCVDTEGHVRSDAKALFFRQ